MLSFAVLLVAVAAAILLYAPMGLIDLWLTVPFVLAVFGVWLMVLGGFKSQRPAKYERGAFSTFAWGLLMVAVGGAWLLYGFSWAYSVAVLLLVTAALAIASTLRARKSSGEMQA